MYYLAADTFVKVPSASTATCARRKYIIMEKFRITGSVLVTKKIGKFRVCGSVLLQIFNKTTKYMHNKFKIYCFVAYTPLNMFRAPLCPSSGAPSNCLCSHWLPYDCRVGRASSCGRFTSKQCPKHVERCIRDKAISFKFIVHLVGCFIENSETFILTNEN
jgi:hypothetical protein